MMPIIALALVITGCRSEEREVGAASTPVAEAETKPVVIQRFELSTRTISGRDPVNVTVLFLAAYPTRSFSVDWYGPRGWLLRSTVLDPRLMEQRLSVPPRMFHSDGTYRAVLRSGTRALAEDTITRG